MASNTHVYSDPFHFSKYNKITNLFHLLHSTYCKFRFTTTLQLTKHLQHDSLHIIRD